MKHVLMGDTDSCYVRLDLCAERLGIERKPKEMIALADRLQKKMQERLPAVLSERFCVSEKQIGILEAGREIVGRSALFKDKKKRYAVHVINQEGFAPKKGKEMKVMGMETRRSDTPKFIQEFLTDCLKKVVMEDCGYDEMRKFVEEFRKKFRAMEPWRQGSPVRVKKLASMTKDYETWKNKVQTGVPAKKMHFTHINTKGSFTTNMLIEHHGEKRWDLIRDGDKVEIIYLRPNDELMECVAIKAGETYIPEWFKQLPFDSKRMEEKLIDKKVENVIGAIMNWDFAPNNVHTDGIIEVDDFYG